MVRADLKVIYSAINDYQVVTGQFPASWEDLSGYIDISKYKDKYEINP